MERGQRLLLTLTEKPEGAPQRIILWGALKRITSKKRKQRMQYRTARLSKMEEGHDRHGSRPPFGTLLEAVANCLWTF